MGECVGCFENTNRQTWKHANAVESVHTSRKYNEITLTQPSLSFSRSAWSESRNAYSHFHQDKANETRRLEGVLSLYRCSSENCRIAATNKNSKTRRAATVCAININYPASNIYVYRCIFLSRINFFLEEYRNGTRPIFISFACRINGIGVALFYLFKFTKTYRFVF